MVYPLWYIIIAFLQCPVDNCYDAMLGLLTCAEFVEVNKIIGCILLLV